MTKINFSVEIDLADVPLRTELTDEEELRIIAEVSRRAGILARNRLRAERERARQDKKG